MLKIMAVAMAAVMLVGGYAAASEMVPEMGSDTVTACCWGNGGGWRGGHRGAGWRHGGRRHGGYNRAGYYQGYNCYYR